MVLLSTDADRRRSFKPGSQVKRALRDAVQLQDVIEGLFRASRGPLMGLEFKKAG